MDTSKMVFSLVEFKEDHSLLTIPSTWIFDNKKYCFYPDGHKSSTSILSKIKFRVVPEPTWKKLKIRVHTYNNTYENCEKDLMQKKGQEASSENSESSEKENQEENLTNSTLDDTIIAPENTDLKTVIRNQKLILKEIFNIRSTLELINSTKNTNCSIMPTIGISDKYILPITNIEELKKLNSILEDKMERNIFMRNMVQVGGKNVQVSTYRIMEKIFTAQLSMEMNWSGKNPNKFAIIKLKNIVLCIVQSVCMTNKGTTEHDVETNIKNYLRTAKDRLRLREKQQQQKPKVVGANSSMYQRQEVDYEELRREITAPDEQIEAIPLANSTISE